MKPINQTLLAIVISLMMVAGFVGVYAAGYQYEQTATPENLFISDSNLEFGNPDLRALYLNAGYTFPGVHSPMWYHRNTNSSVFERQNITMIYINNDTWGGAVSGGNTNVNGGSLIYIPVELPFLKTTILSSIHIRMTLPGDPDQWVQIYITSTHNPHIPGIDDGYNTNIALHEGMNSQTTMYKDYIITPFQGLKMYSGANQNPYTYMAIEMYDENSNGISPFNLELQLSFNGTLITTWSLQDSVNFVLGASIVGNCVLLVYMSDAVDFGGYRKDLSNRSGGKRRKDSWRK